MEDREPSLTERAHRALFDQLIRSGIIDDDDIAATCERLKAAGDDDAAHEVACMMLRASAPDQSDWEAERARARFRTIEGGKGTD